MSGFLNDLRFGFRQLARKPGFATAAILTLALGIGANTAVFSVLSGYLLKPLPYPHSERLVQINEDQAKAGIRFAAISVPNYLSMVKRASDFSALAAYRPGSSKTNLIEGGRAEAIPTNKVTASLFDVLEISPLIGRTFTQANQQPGRGHVVVVSYRFWQRKLGGSRDAIGKTLRLDGDQYKVIGVMPKGFVFRDRKYQLLVPLVWTAKDKADNRRGDDNLKVIGRLKPGIGVAAAGTQLDSVLRQVNRVSGTMRHRTKKYNINWWLQPWHAQLVSGRPTLLYLLQAAVLLVLLITCVNVANLLLARVLARTHEMAMRSALGATRAALARQLLVEGLCLAIPGGAIGVGLAWWALKFIRQLGWGATNGMFSITPDWRVALFAIAAVIVVALVVSLLPIRHFSRVDLQAVLQEGGRSSGGGRGAKRTRNALVVVELALATALLAGSGLLIHSFAKLQAVNPGFNPDNVLVANVVAPPSANQKDAKALKQFYLELDRRAERIPGVTSAGVTVQLPLHCYFNGSFEIKGRSKSRPPYACFNSVSGSYFDALGIRPLRGRVFGRRDTAKSQGVVVIDRLLAKKYFPKRNPVGQYLKFSGRKLRIIGVVPTLKTSLTRPTTMGMIYFPVSQALFIPGRKLVVRASIAPHALVQPLTKLVANINPNISVTHFRTMHHVMADKLKDRHATMLLVIAFGAIALALAIVGVYGVMSYAVSQRRAECGVRLALGAQPSDLSRMILKDGLKLLATGLVIGLGLAVLFGYLMSAQLFSVAPFDPVTLAGTAIVMALITVAACWLPARRAAKLDPAVAIMEQ